MNCAQAKRYMPGYLDGAISASSHAGIRAHVAECRECFSELQSYNDLSHCLASVGPVAPPSDLAVRIRLQASRAQVRVSVAQRIWSRVAFTFDNILRPIAVPATGGVLTALVAFVLIVQNILVGIPMGGIVPNDIAMNIVQPARLESLADFQMPGMIAGPVSSGALTIDATLNTEGQVVSYTILAGPNDTATHHQLDQVMMFSRFTPGSSFGYPTSGSHIMISFSEVRVRG
jgi:anti-sigma factor RsiW